MKKLLVYLKDYKKETVLAPLFKLLEASFELFVPLVMAAIIDNGIANGDRGYIGRMCLVLIALGIIGLTCSITAQYFAARAAVGFAAQMKQALFAHIQSLSFTEMDTVGTSTLITRMTSDANQVQNGVNMVLRLFLRSPFIVFGAMIMAFTIDVKAALVFVAAIPLLSIVVFGIMVVTTPMYRKVQGGLDAVLGITRENLTGVRVLRAFNKEESERKRFEATNGALAQMQKAVGRLSALDEPGHLHHHQRRGDRAGLDRGLAGGKRGHHPGRGGRSGQLYVADPGGADQAGQPDRHHHKGHRLRNRIESIFEMSSSLTDPAAENWKKAAENGRKAAENGQKTPAGASRTQDVPAVAFEHVCLTYKNAGAESLTDIDFQARPGRPSASSAAPAPENPLWST